MLTNVVHVEPRGGYRLFLQFSDGTESERDFSEMVRSDGPMIRPLKDPAYFARVFLDYGAPTWPNGFDMAPDALHHDMRSAGQLSRSDAAEGQSDQIPAIFRQTTSVERYPT
jgi:hypothetical protein